MKNVNPALIRSSFWFDGSPEVVNQCVRDLNQRLAETLEDDPPALSLLPMDRRVLLAEVEGKWEEMRQIYLALMTLHAAWTAAVDARDVQRASRTGHAACRAASLASDGVELVSRRLSLLEQRVEALTGSLTRVVQAVFPFDPVDPADGSPSSPESPPVADEDSS